jgi:hypothetical protein
MYLNPVETVNGLSGRIQCSLNHGQHFCKDTHTAQSHKLFFLIFYCKIVIILKKVSNKMAEMRSEGKRPHGTCRHRWEDNIRMDLREIG